MLLELPTNACEKYPVTHIGPTHILSHTPVVVYTSSSLNYTSLDSSSPCVPLFFQLSNFLHINSVLYIDILQTSGDGVLRHLLFISPIDVMQWLINMLIY